MNQHEAQFLPLGKFMDRLEGWGRQQGRNVYQRLLQFVEGNPGTVIFRISMTGVQRMDISFASEAIVELVLRFRRSKGFIIVDPSNADLTENIDAACMKKNQPITVLENQEIKIIGPKPSEGTREALEYVMDRPNARASDLAIERGISLQNASMKLKKLWDQGFLLRRERASESGGVEYVYYRIS